MRNRLSKALAQLWDSCRWRYGTVLCGHKARRHRLLGTIQMRVCGQWKTAHTNLREQFKSL